jgi:hypothetical protein
VCQAHRIADNDPLVRSMARELLLVMGEAEFPYMLWAAETAGSLVRKRIYGIMRAICGGARPSPTGTWPSVDACITRLRHTDEIIAIMAAQIVELRRATEALSLDHSTESRIRELLLEAQERPWFLRFGQEPSSGRMHGAGVILPPQHQHMFRLSFDYKAEGSKNI